MNVFAISVGKGTSAIFLQVCLLLTFFTGTIIDNLIMFLTRRKS